MVKTKHQTMTVGLQAHDSHDRHIRKNPCLGTTDSHELNEFQHLGLEGDSYWMDTYSVD